MFANKPFRFPENVPVPVPLVILELATVGFTDVDQQTPREVIAAPPSEVTLPPPLADEVVTAEIVVVVIVGRAAVGPAVPPAQIKLTYSG